MFWTYPDIFKTLIFDINMIYLKFYTSLKYYKMLYVCVSENL